MKKAILIISGVALGLGLAASYIQATKDAKKKEEEIDREMQKATDEINKMKEKAEKQFMQTATLKKINLTD